MNDLPMSVKKSSALADEGARAMYFFRIEYVSGEHSLSRHHNGNLSAFAFLWIMSETVSRGNEEISSYGIFHASEVAR